MCLTLHSSSLWPLVEGVCNSDWHHCVHFTDGQSETRSREKLVACEEDSREFHHPQPACLYFTTELSSSSASSFNLETTTLLICYLFTLAPPSSFMILPLHDMQATFWYSGLSSEVTCSESSFQAQLASLVLLYWIILFYCLYSNTTAWNYLVQLFVYCLLLKWNLHENRSVLFTTESIMPRIVTGTEQCSIKMCEIHYYVCTLSEILMTGRLAHTRKMEICVPALTARLVSCHLCTSAFSPVKSDNYTHQRIWG